MPLEAKQQHWLAESLKRLGDSLNWERATLAAFLICDQHDIDALDRIIQATRVELLVTLTLQCSKFTLSRSDDVSGLYTRGSQAQGDINIQLFAYASRRLQGTQPKLSVERF